jgi:hypothetical protein
MAKDLKNTGKIKRAIEKRYADLAKQTNKTGIPGNPPFDLMFPPEEKDDYLDDQSLRNDS